LIKVHYCIGRRRRPTQYNFVLTVTSRHVRDRFMAVASCYSVFCPLQSVGVIKSAVRTSFTETVCVLCTVYRTWVLIIVLCIFYAFISFHCVLPYGVG